MTLTHRLLVRRTERVLRRAARDERRRVEREMAAYCTPAQRADLLATPDRYPDEVTRRFREALRRPPRRASSNQDLPAFRYR